jgi:hypothetical protein
LEHLAEDAILGGLTTRVLAVTRPNPKQHSMKAKKEVEVKKRGRKEAANYRTR